MKTKLVGTGAALILATAVGFGPGAVAANAAPPAAAAAAQPVMGSVDQVLSGTFTPVGGIEQAIPATATLSNLTASVVDGVLQLTGTITGLPGQGPVDFTAPVESLQASAACDILTLDLGPLDLDVLGLVIELNQVELDITAVPGPGNLLGNLLCAVAGLLDGNGPLDGIAALLNRLLAGLGL